MRHGYLSIKTLDHKTKRLRCKMVIRWNVPWNMSQCTKTEKGAWADMIIQWGAEFSFLLSKLYEKFRTIFWSWYHTHGICRPPMVAIIEPWFNQSRLFAVWIGTSTGSPLCENIQFDGALAPQGFPPPSKARKDQLQASASCSVGISNHETQLCHSQRSTAPYH